MSDQRAGGYEDEYEVDSADRRSGDQRRDAFRVAMNMPVYVDEPMDQTRTVRELVHGHQRRLLLAERPAALDRRQSWLRR